ncbi:hypothetical protein J6590_048093 [Homalodisca vitripennis]|nr:hypothetical protein J6590_095372 [Homalodisca vitripennis]KAG8281975.1 hypothetical protein J6590_048093 [Homalodisca vitripennis]
MSETCPASFLNITFHEVSSTEVSSSTAEVYHGHLEVSQSRHLRLPPSALGTISEEKTCQDETPEWTKNHKSSRHLKGTVMGGEDNNRTERPVNRAISRIVPPPPPSQLIVQSTIGRNG